jgi:hypothetical protein
MSCVVVAPCVAFSFIRAAETVSGRSKMFALTLKVCMAARSEILRQRAPK